MKKKLSDLLKEYRLNKGLTQQEVADKVFANRTTYTKWETGNSEIPFSKLKKYIEQLELNDAEILEIMSESKKTTKNETLQKGYEKTIGYSSFVMKWIFEQHYMQYVIVSEGQEIPFEELTQEDRDSYKQETGEEFTEEIYKKYYAWHMRDILEEDYYQSFELLLKDNPICIMMFQFGLFGNEYYNEYWERFKVKNKLPYNINFGEEDKKTQENYSKAIDSISHHLNFSYSVNYYPHMINHKL